jgi:hypothetical protein
MDAQEIDTPSPVVWILLAVILSSQTILCSNVGLKHCPHPRARIQQQLNQQGLTAIDEAFEHANSLGP